jgi:hypothetical protein
MSDGTEIPFHPLIPAPSVEQIREEMRLTGREGEAAIRHLLRMRAQVMADEARDPFSQGYEPPTWKVADALLDWPWCGAGFVAELEGRFEWARLRQETTPGQARQAGANAPAWDEFKRRMRARLGFEFDSIWTPTTHMSNIKVWIGISTMRAGNLFHSSILKMMSE